MSHAFQLRITCRFSIHKYGKAGTVHAMIVDGEVKGQVHVFLTLAQDVGVVSFMPWMIYPRAKQLHYPRNIRMVGPQRGSAYTGEERNLLLQPQIK